MGNIGTVASSRVALEEEAVVIVLTCEQGSREWDWKRALGIPTASAVLPHRDARGGRRPRSAEQLPGRNCWLSTSLGYAGRRVQWSQRMAGAREARWSRRRGATTPSTGTWTRAASGVLPTRDDARARGHVARMDWSEIDGLLELKCPMPGRHLVYLARGVVPKAYVMQVQGQLWVTGREWVDFMSYHALSFLRSSCACAPDPKMQDALDAAIPAFVAQLCSRHALDSRQTTGSSRGNAGEPSDPSRATLHGRGRARLDGGLVRPLPARARACAGGGGNAVSTRRSVGDLARKSAGAGFVRGAVLGRYSG